MVKIEKMSFLFWRLYSVFRGGIRRLLGMYVFGKKSSTPCNICNGSVFIKGPNGRLSSTGCLPMCPRCGSLERHRGLREFWSTFPRDYLAQSSVLQFSADPSLDPSWCQSLEVSIYGLYNSLDLQKINRPDESYDIVILNQVLEHVPDDKKALNEALRITKSDGFVQLNVPSPLTFMHTEDWGYPEKEKHGHYRTYGADIEELFDQIVGSRNHHRCIITDPITGERDCIFILCHSRPSLNRIIDLCQSGRIIT